MTNQEIFDKVARHLLTQGECSFDEASQRCLYRDDYGRRCAVGCLIPDDQYSPAFEGISVAAIPHATPKSPTAFKLLEVLTSAGVTRDQASLLRDLQGIHDAAAPRIGMEEDPEIELLGVVSYWRRSLRDLAASYGLTLIPELQ